MDVINSRRSVRKFQSKPVEKEKIEALLKAAMQAPSAGNQQSWEFLVIQDSENLKQLGGVSPHAKPVLGSAVSIVLLGNEEKMKYPEYWEQDLGAATQNILLETVTQGLGGVWLGVAPKEDRMEYIIKMFDLPSHIKPYGIIAIGYPEGESNKFVDRYNPSAVHYEKY